MTMLTEIAADIAANIGGVVGTSIFIGDIPKDPDAVISLFQYAGQSSNLSLGQSRDVRPQLQILVRSALGDYLTGAAKVESIFTRYDGLTNTTIGSTLYKSIIANGQPSDYGGDAMGRPMWEMNFSVVKNP